jgi:Zn-dependent protease
VSGVPGLDITDFMIRAPVIFFSLTVHEFMHAWTAWKCGDDTALRAGRVTLNPLAHLDPLGTILLFVGPIGWAKPVPVNPANFDYQTRRRDEILVGGAGVAANFALGVFFALVLRFFWNPLAAWEGVGQIILTMAFYGSYINFALAIFNLLPIPPLDGSHILKNLLPLNAAIVYTNLARYGPFALLAFVVFNYLIGGAMGFSLLGYPVSRLVDLFSGS